MDSPETRSGGGPPSQEEAPTEEAKDKFEDAKEKAKKINEQVEEIDIDPKELLREEALEEELQKKDAKIEELEEELEEKEEEEEVEEITFEPENWIDLSKVEKRVASGTEEELELDVKPGIDEGKTFEVQQMSVCAVTEDGEVCQGYAAPGVVEQLKEQGFEEGNSIGVPIAAPEELPDWRSEKMYNLRDEALEEKRQKGKEEHLQDYQERAEERGIEEIDKTNWILVDGEVEDTGERERDIKENSDGTSKPEERWKNLGTFNIEGNTIAIVDEKGQKLVAPHTEERVWQLEDANYERSDIGVPLASGGELESYKQGKFEEMREEAQSADTFEEEDERREEKKKRRRENKEE